MATKNDFELSAKDFVVSSPNPLYDRPAVQNHIHVGKSQDMRRQIKCQPSIKQIGLLPAVNCPEKIVICLDISNEMMKETFRSKSGDRSAPLTLIKRALGIYIHTKHRLNKNHQFALVLLRENSVWVCDFTSDPDKIITIMNEMKETSSYNTFDFTTLFQSIEAKQALPPMTESSKIPPFVLRVLVIYGRSHCKPAFTSRESLKTLYSSPWFFLDCYYIHEPVSEDNQCEDIYNQLCELDEKGQSYVLEASRNPTKLYDAMAQLLGHPLQRPLQNDCCYSIERSPEQSPT